MVAEYGVNDGTIDWTNIYEYNSGSGTFTEATSYTAGRKYFRATNILSLTDDYYPIVWSVDDAEQTSLQAALEAMVANIGNATYNANDLINKATKLTWAWVFDVDGNDARDKADTILGNLMAGNTETQMVAKKSGTNYITNLGGTYNLEVKCGFEITATQVD